MQARPLAALSLALLLAPAAFPIDDSRELLAARLGELSASPSPALFGEPLFQELLLNTFYADREFRPVWDAPGRATELLDLVRGSFEHGLDPADYHMPALEAWVPRMVEGGLSPHTAVELEILLTASLLRLGYHLRFGKVDPTELDADWNLSRAAGVDGPVENIRKLLDAPSLTAAWESVAPQGPIYEPFRRALARYRQIADRGGWPTVPPGPTLDPGVQDPRVVALRRRLQVTGEWTAGAMTDSFDEALAQAVRSFQRRHRLGVDGRVGPATLAALNVPVERRIDQIRVNLERARWVHRDVEPRMLLVNVAGFEVLLVEGTELRWRSRAIVGKTYRKTPIFAASMKYLVLNPTWTVPPTILAKDVLPAIRRDPDYLDRKNMRILTRDGEVVDPGSIDWPSVSPRNFGYVVRQDPGPDNALGLIKFIFPNPHFVFLHDTPTRNLFDREERTFSSGCIRVEHPLELAEILLEDPNEWGDEAIERVIESGKTDTVFLPEPLRVLLLYWTVEPDFATGDVHFLNDVYGRDGRVLAALDGDFTFSPPEGFEQHLQSTDSDALH